MRKGIALAKTFKKPKMFDLEVKNKYNVINNKIEDKFTLNSMLKEMNLEPLMKYDEKYDYIKSEDKTISANEVDAFNANLIKQKNFKIDIKASKPETMRIGLIGEKVGMTSFFNRFGAQIPLTVVKVENNQVTNITKIANNKYMVEVGAGLDKKASLAKKGHFYKNLIPPKKHIKSFKVTEESLLPIGYLLYLRHFIVGQKVDVQANSKGKGFQGVMYRWGFSGGNKSHGASLKHRACGSIGNREFPARVFPGKKMAGRTGNELCTVRGIQIYKADVPNGLLYLRGSIPGNTYAKVVIKDCFHFNFNQSPFLMCPTFLPEEGKVYEDVTTFYDTEDPFEKYPHDNDERMGIPDEEEEGPQEEEDETEL